MVDAVCVRDGYDGKWLGGCIDAMWVCVWLVNKFEFEFEFAQAT